VPNHEPFLVVEDFRVDFALFGRTRSFQRRRSISAVSGVSDELAPGEHGGLVGESVWHIHPGARDSLRLVNAQHMATSSLKAPISKLTLAAGDATHRRHLQRVFQNPLPPSTPG